MTKNLSIAALLLFLVFTNSAHAQTPSNPWWFDFGIAKSPLAQSYSRVLPTSRWAKNQLIGWKRRPSGFGAATSDPLSDYNVLDGSHSFCIASNLLPVSSSVPAYDLSFDLSGLRPPARLRGESYLVAYQDLPPIRGRRQKPLILFGLPLNSLARASSPAQYLTRTASVQNFFGRPTCFLLTGPIRRIALHALRVNAQALPPTPTPTATPSPTATPTPSQTPTPQPSGTPTPGSASAPTSLSARAVSSTEVTLFWTASNNFGIRVERGDGTSGEFQTVLDLPANSNAYTDVSIFADHNYTYQVRALDQQGNASLPSNQQNVTTPQAGPSNLAVVSNLSFSPTSVNSGTIRWNDPNTADGSRQNFVERSDNGGLLYRVIALVGTENSFTDAVLTPGKSYSYRVMVGSNGGDFNTYSEPLTVNLPARTTGKPIEPSGTTAVAQTGGKVFLSWTNNDPTNPQFSIERANFDPWHPMSFSVVGTTAGGATSFTDSGLSAETPYSYRIRAQNGSGFSGYDSETPVATASLGTGSAKNYHIGPGQTYPNIADLNWSIVGPGDTVSIHYKPGGYHEIFQIASRGTESSWITVTGVPDPTTGDLPIIDGTNAVMAPQFVNHYAPLSGSGAIVIGARPNYLAGYKPGYLVLQNLEIRNAYSANSFQDYDGSTKQYGDVGAGVYIERADHITIRSNSIHHNGEGIFGAGQSGFDRLMSDLLIQANDLHDNGNVGRYLEHQSYLEAVNVTYEFNHYGKLRDGAGGANIKDRSVNTIIRFNRIEGGAHQLQLPESENQAALALTLPSYRLLRAYGNIIYNPPGDAASPVLYGSDHGNLPFYRKGILSFAYNTVVTQSDQTGPSGVYKVDIFELQGAGQILDARNNIILGIPEHPGNNPSDLGIIGGFDSAYLGRNWFSPHWTASIGNGYNFQGQIYGSENVITNSSNDPGFVNASGLDFHLASGSQCIDQGQVGAAGAWSLSSQYLDPNAGQTRLVNGAASDLGAFEH